MKKILMAFVALFSVVSVAMAKDDVTVTSGSLAGLNAGEVKVFVVWDYSNATLEGKAPKAFLAEKGQDWVDGYPAELQKAENYFTDYVNKKSKTVKIVDDRNAADYVMTIKVGDFHYGSVGLSVVIGMGAGDAHLHADITVNKESTNVAEINVDGVPGSGMGNEIRRSNCYYNLARWFVKLVKRAK